MRGERSMYAGCTELDEIVIAYQTGKDIVKILRCDLEPPEDFPMFMLTRHLEFILRQNCEVQLSDSIYRRKMRSSSVDFYILETLKHEQAHLTSHEVFLEIQRQLPAVNPSTVYRALERLAKAGKVSVSDMGTGSEVYESVDGENHHHLVCQNCGRVITIKHDEVDPFFQKLERDYGFKIITNHLVLFGVCEDCREKTAGQV